MRVGSVIFGTAAAAAAAAADCAAGGPVQIFVRPEDVVVTIDGAAPAAGNSVSGCVEATVIVGGLDRKLLVRLGNGTIVESLVRAGAADVTTGTRVRASWPVEKTLVYGRRP